MSRQPAVAFVPRNRLAPMLSGMDGKSFTEHVAEAEEAVERIVPVLIKGLESDVRALIRLCRQDEGEIFGQGREIGWLALRIVESARLAGLTGLAEAAKGVWEMIDALSGRGVWHTEALRVHADALGVLASAPQDGPEGSAITRELLRLREAIGAGPKT